MAMQNFFVLKVTCKRTLRQLVICLRPSHLLDFCLGGVGSESVHIQSGKPVEYGLHYDSTPPPPHPPHPSHRGGGGHWK